MEHVLKDERFAHIGTDVRFRSVPRRERKVKIDKRFQSMFTEKRFKVKYSVDKRGRPQNYTTDDNLKKYYELTSSSSDEEDDSDLGGPNQKMQPLRVDPLPSVDVSDYKESKMESSKRKGKLSMEKKITSGKSADKGDEKTFVVDYSRGEGNVTSSSSDENSSDEEGDEAAAVVHPWGELSIEAPQTDQVTRRLAICNMDWDRISARDLYVLVDSFTPPGGNVASVKVYLSDYGRERLREEEVCGPKELTECKPVDDDSRANDLEGEKYHMEKLRRYQLNRLKYYYAVVECDSQETANKIYDECDGLEYENSAAKLDLRFIPDDITFDDQPQSTACGSADLNSYRPKYFTTTALQHAKVKLTWDETDPGRLHVIQRAFDQDDEQGMDLGTYLATSSSEESDASEHCTEKKPGEENEHLISDEEHEDQRISRYRALLQNIEAEEEAKKKDKEVELEITWGTGLKARADAIVQSKVAQKELTPWERYLETKKEKRKKKKEKKEQVANVKVDNDGDAENPYSDDELPSDVDLNDPFFDKGHLGNLPIQSVNNRNKNRGNSQSKDKQKMEEEDGQKKAELELLLMDDDHSKRHFSLKKLINVNKSKEKKLKVCAASTEGEDFSVNVCDPRFSAIFDSHAYSIDPSEPNFKRTKGMEALIQEKQRRQQEQRSNLSSSANKNEKLDAPWSPADSALKNTSFNKNELSLLVKSVKRKAFAHKQKRKK